MPSCTCEINAKMVLSLLWELSPHGLSYLRRRETFKKK